MSGLRPTQHPLQLALGIVILCAGLYSPAQAASGPLLSELLIQLTPAVEIDRPAHEQSLPSRSTALDFADSANVDIHTDTAGRWTQSNGTATWRLRLHSAKAHSLSLTLSDLQLPADAELRLYDGEGFLWHGPYRSDNLTRHSRFWTPLIPGENMLLELNMPVAQQANAALRVSQLHYGYRDLNNQAKSGSCNVDVACSQADAWTDAVQATARISIGGRRLCSAVLLNNTSLNGDPLVLTAQHCGIGSQPEFSADSVVVYWNFQSSQCGGSPNGNLSQNQSGATLLAQGSSADFSLIRLDRVPPSNYQVYYAGWDANGAAPSNGVSAHHPSGHEKRISFYNQRANRRTANVDGASVQSWEVFWSEGVTEAGSSGAGLWNESHRVIGQLSGGNSSCDAQGRSDVYGRLDVAWQESAAASGQLKAWLDPGNTGQRTLDGTGSSSGVLKANQDEYNALPSDRQTLRLDVLSNDAGTPPLQVLAANAANGEVWTDGQFLFYSFIPGSDSDALEYQIMDRWGDTQSASVNVQRDAKSLPLRGGSLGFWSLLLVLLSGSMRASRWRQS